ncbi:hypothetical protein PINS_up000177 [Pythium insidiosum]|nr:hypothetical protein PINS_up000177 [Pythium insidiosum]
MASAGWSDTERWTVLLGLRKLMLHFIYSTDDSVAQEIQRDVPGKSTQEVVEMVRLMMKDFAFAFSTKSFRKDVLIVNNTEVFVCEYLYDTVVVLQENHRGGVWHPDDLSRFLSKIKTYRHLLDKSHELFFSRIQIWGKSVTETRNKFYALRELYLEEKKRVSPQDSIHQHRLALLDEIYREVGPPAPSNSDPITTTSKAMKLWTSDELEILVQCIVDITLQIQQHGTSPLIKEVAQKLGRTEQSCVTKLSDMQERFKKKSTYFRAAHLPDVIFDPESVAHKIFSAEWTNYNDPYAMGVQALRSYSNKVVGQRQKKKTVVRRSLEVRQCRLASLGSKESDSTKSVNDLATITHPSKKQRTMGVDTSRIPAPIVTTLPLPGFTSVPQIPSAGDPSANS